MNNQKIDFYYDHEIGEWMMSEVKPREEDPVFSKELKVCLHEYILYQGFTDNFYYCKKCDIKKREATT